MSLNRFSLKTVLTVLTDAVSQELDTEEERLRKGMLVFFAIDFIIAGSLWGLVYFLLQRPLAAAFPFGYAVFSLISLVIFLKSKRYQFFRRSKLSLILLLPFLVQWTLGGFYGGSGVMLWALLSPIGALMFGGSRNANRWLGAFVLLTLVSGGMDPWLSTQAVLLDPAVIRAFFVMNFLGVSLIAYFCLKYFVQQREQMMLALSNEQQKAERLLMQMLPPSIAERLKEEHRSIADGFSEVTVLFADIVGFTDLSGRIPPSELVEMLDEVFTAFDGLAQVHGLEKIKTIGDAYMVAGGLPVVRSDHAEAVAEMALKMLEVLKTCPAARVHGLQLRIGINSGPVVAGVIGRQKFIYDLWGDTVNIASRMESQGSTGCIHIAQRTYELVRDRFRCEARGTVSIKGKGDMSTYFLVGPQADSRPSILALS